MFQVILGECHRLTQRASFKDFAESFVVVLFEPVLWAELLCHLGVNGGLGVSCH
jgi:hypothetical protein